MIRVRHPFIGILTPSFLSLSQDAFKGVYEVSFSVEYFVTFGDWIAKDGECSKCSSVGGGPITLVRECKPKIPKYSCDGVKNMEDSKDCLKYCDSSAGI